MRTTSGTLPTDYTFTGQKLDASSSLMYYGARYYDAIGRFAQPDSIVPNPYDPQSLNRYSYVLNNPMRYTDPTGHCALVEEDGLCTRFDEDDNIVVVDGGATFPNYVEVALANAFLSGDPSYVERLPDNISAASMTRSIRHVALELGYRPADPVAADYALNAELVLGVGLALNKATQTNGLTAPGALRPGMNGNADHRAGVAAAKKYFDEMYNKSDFVIESNKSVKDELNIDRRPDLSVRRLSDWELVHVLEVARTTPGGSWIPREAVKMAQYMQAGLNFTFWKVP